MRVLAAVPITKRLVRFAILEKLVKRAKPFAERIATPKCVLAGPIAFAKSPDAIAGFLQHFGVVIELFAQRPAEAIAFLQLPMMLPRKNAQPAGRAGRSRNNCPSHDPPVTIRHLLEHTSGIQSLTDLLSYRLLMRHDVTHDDMIQRFKDLPLHFDPGTRFRYCNSGYYLLGVVLEAKAEMSYEDYLQQHVFKPLHLEHTYYDRARSIIPNRARGYSGVGDRIENPTYLSMTQPFSAGALASTVTDLIAWQRGLVGLQVLDEASFTMMSTKGVTSSGEEFDYGMGLFIQESAGRNVIRHGGGINGFRSALAHYPDSGHTIVVLANSETAQPAAISDRIAGILFETL